MVHFDELKFMLNILALKLKKLCDSLYGIILDLFVMNFE